MNKKTYLKNLKEIALEKGYLDEEIKELIIYADVLLTKKLPVIFSVKQLALFIGVDERYLYKVSNKPSLFYNKYSIQKKNGKKRNIHEPLPTLKYIQKWINENILSQIKSSPFSKAYKKKLSIKDNAKYHVNQEYVICMDIKDYFGTINQYQVFKMFNELGYNEPVSSMLSRLCCLNKSLPQGSPTSPALSNIITILLDLDISKYTKSKSDKNYSIRYTRYADDITLSSNILDVNKTILDITKILKKHGFKVNKEKTRVLKQNKSQKVTGIVVNKKINVPKKIKKELRQEMYYIKKFGLIEHMNKVGISNETTFKYICRLLGKINFVITIEKDNKEFIEYKEEMINLYNKNYKL